MQLEPAALAHVLAVWPVARLASVGADGPHIVPIVFAAIDGVLYSPIDGKPKRGADLQRLRNVAHNPAVGVMLDHYERDWRRLWWLRIDAKADAISTDAIGRVGWNRIVEALREKYPQYETVAMFAAAPTLLRITPYRHTAWSAQRFDWETLR